MGVQWRAVVCSGVQGLFCGFSPRNVKGVICERQCSTVHWQAWQSYRGCAVLRLQVWDLRHPDAVRLQDTWWQHILQCGVEDQVSVFVVAQLFAPDTVKPLPGNMVYASLGQPFESFDAFAQVLP